MKKCFYCNYENREQAKICGKCGKSFGDFVLCEKCNNLIPNDYHYCDLCGQQHSDVARVQEKFDPVFKSENSLKNDSDENQLMKDTYKDELRYITVLFADVSGFTRWSEKKTPEDIKIFMNNLFIKLSNDIEDAGGRVDKYIGDCIMAVFGAPQSKDDDPIRAVRAALKMQESLSSFIPKKSSEQTPHLQMRIGINSGFALAGSIGSEKTKSYTVMGDTVNIASRIESIANPGEIYISDETRKMISEKFDTFSMGEVTVKGKSQPIVVHKVIGYRSLSDSDKTVTCKLTSSFIGRERELQQVLYWLNNAEMKLSSMIIGVHGKRGVGKTRFIDELLKKIEHSTYAVSIDNSLFEMLNPCNYFSLLIKRFLPKKIDEQEILLQKVFHGIEYLLPKSLKDIVQNTINGNFDEIYQDYETLKLTLFMILTRLIIYFKKEYQKNTILILSEVEHLHDVIKDFIEYSENLQKEEPFAYSIIFENSFQRLPAFVNLNNYHEITIPAFTHSETSSYIENIQNSLQLSFPSEMNDQIWRFSGGIPLLICEQMKIISQHGANNSNKILHKKETKLSQVSGSIYQLFQADFDSLTEEERKILKYASLIGDIFWDHIIRLFFPNFSIEKIISIFQSLSFRDYIQEKTILNRHQMKEYRFTNTFFREVIYNTIPKHERKTLHLQIAKKIQESVFADDFLMIIHDQFLKAENILLAWKPACRLIDNYLNKMMISEGFELVEKYCDVQENNEDYESLKEINTEAILYKTELFYHKGDYFKVIEMSNVYAQNPNLAKNYSIAFKIQISKSLHKLGKHHEVIDLITSFHNSEDYHTVTQNTQLEMLCILAWSYLELRQFQIAQKVCEDFLQSKIQDDDNSVKFQNLLSSLFDTLGETYRRNNEIEKAEYYYLQAKNIRIQNGNIRLLCDSDNNLAIIETMKNNYDRATHLFHELYNKRKFIGAPFGLGVASANLAETLILSGQKDNALPYIKKCGDIGSSIHSPILTEAEKNLSSMLQ